MTEEPAKPAEAGNKGPVAGERLAEARRAREVSLDEIARELHLDEIKVRALEQNAFDNLGAPVFIKGYLRKYATLVGVSGDDILADYEGLNHSSSAPPIIGLRKHPSPGVSPGPWIAGAAAFAVIALGAWWFLSSDIELPGDDATPAPTIPATEERSVPDLVAEEPSPDTQEEQELAVDTVPEDAAAGAEPVPAAPSGREADTQTPAAGETALSLTYSGDCWTEVTDAEGERLFFGLGTEGRTVAVSGMPPLQVLLGDSDNVSVEVDGTRYRIPGSARRGDTARFTIAR